MSVHPFGSSLLLASAAALCVACAPLQVLPSSSVVEGRVQGQNGAYVDVPDTVLMLRHDDNTSTRTLYRASTAQQHVRSVRLAMTEATGLPFTEEWHLLHLSREAQRPGNEPVIVEFSGDPGFVRRHVGELAWVTARRHDLALPTGSFTDFREVSLRPGGASVLARIEDDDPVLAWTSTTCDPLANMPLAVTLRSFATGGIDCFDLQSMSSMLLNQLALTLTDAARQQNARATAHSLAIVPHIATPASGGSPQPRPGIGFIYRTTLEPLLAGVGAAPFTGTLTVSIPITWVFGRQPGSNTLITALDPMTPAVAGTTLANIPRITVHAVDGSITAAFAEQLRTGIADAMTNAPTPTGPGGIGLNAFLDLLLVLTVMQGDSSPPADFSVIALPTDRTVEGAPQNTVLRMGAVVIQEVSGLTPPLPGGVGARTVLTRPGGRVSVTENLDATGSTIRRFDLPLPSEPLPFNLVLLR